MALFQEEKEKRQEFSLSDFKHTTNIYPGGGIISPLTCLPRTGNVCTKSREIDSVWYQDTEKETDSSGQHRGMAARGCVVLSCHLDASRVGSKMSEYLHSQGLPGRN